MSTLEAMFASARDRGRAAFLPYLMAGTPTPSASVDLFVALAEAGADGFEVGIPYADPLMDGPVIQTAGTRALAAGTTMQRGLEVAGEVAARTGKPCLVMTYVNPILRIGATEFAARAADAGVRGLIVADLPVDEAGPIREALKARGLGLVLFAAPTTPDHRLRQVVEAGPPFVYGVAEMGVTGERGESSRHAAALSARIKELTEIPVVLGVGIGTPEAARSAAAIADGVIVGSALVRRVIEAEDASQAERALRTAGAEFAAAMQRA